MQIRCNFPDISYLSETQKNNFQFLNKDNWTVFQYGEVSLYSACNEKHAFFTFKQHKNNDSISSQAATNMKQINRLIYLIFWLT